MTLEAASETVTPAVQEPPAEQVQQVEAVSTEATTEQTQEQQTETQEEAPKKEPWFQKRIGELTREKYEARRAAEDAAREVQELRQRVERIQRGEQDQTPPTADVQTLVQQEAARLVEERRFNEACNKVYATGKSEFQDFDQAVGNLQMVGAPKALLEFVAASDAGAKLIHHLGTDLDEAARIAQLPPVLMARELTRLEFKLSQPQAKPVSKAPAPITPVSGTSGGSKDPADMSDAEFAKWRRAQIAKRS